MNQYWLAIWVFVGVLGGFFYVVEMAIDLIAETYKFFRGLYRYWKKP